nr:glycoside hydrolase family 97 catalytic domain-containing protein [Calditrichia bacterium]
DGQSMMSYYQDIFEAAAAFQLVVNCHGATLPRGWQRTYPNLLSMESIKGFEFVTFEQGNADLQPSHSAVIPFTRNVFDPMDFTPMAFSEVPNIERRTSGAFELATAIVFQSGVQHYAETPRGMARVPAFVRDFVKAIPPVWEDIRFLDGFPGQYAVLARKSGENWFIGGLNGQNQARELRLDLSVLGEGAAILITDGDNNRSFRQQTISVKKGNPLVLSLPAHGGFALRLSAAGN